MAFSYSDAIMMRDLMVANAQEIINNSRPEPRYAQVITIIPADRRCLVLFPGDTTPVSVSYGSMRPKETGQWVRVEGPPGSGFIADVQGDTYTDSTLSALGTTVINLDAAVVKTSGNQTIAGVKTFSSSPIVPQTPTTATQVASKGYTDSAINAAEPLVNEFYTTAKPSFNHNTFTKVVWNINGVADGGCTRSGSTSDITINKAGWWHIEGFIKYDYRDNIEARFCNILVWNGSAWTRMACMTSSSKDGGTFISRHIYFDANDKVAIEGFHFTGTTLQAEQGLNNTAMVCTWMK